MGSDPARVYRSGLAPSGGGMKLSYEQTTYLIWSTFAVCLVALIAVVITA